MIKTRKIALLHTCIVYILAMGCITVIGVHMCFVYMGGQSMSMAKQIEEEIYDIRGRIVQIASTGIENIDTQNIVASHLVVAELMTVSLSQ